MRKTVGQYVMIPALKQVIAYYSDDAAWGDGAPAAHRVERGAGASIIEGLKKLDFDMPGLDRTQAKAA